MKPVQLTAHAAEYNINVDGSIKVVNRGIDPVTSIWKEATGRACFVSVKNTGML